jgi:hypothetical protein
MPLAMVIVMAMAVEEDALPPMPPSTLRRRYHLLESSMWKNPYWRSQV